MSHKLSASEFFKSVHYQPGVHAPYPKYEAKDDQVNVQANFVPRKLDFGADNKMDVKYNAAAPLIVEQLPPASAQFPAPSAHADVDSDDEFEEASTQTVHPST